MSIEPIIAVAIGGLGMYLYNRHQASPAAASVSYKAPNVTAAPAVAPVASTQQPPWPWIAVGVMALALWYSLYQQRDVASKPAHAGLLGKAFSTNDDRAQASRDAKRFGRLCLSLADAIEDDAKLAQPFFKNGIQLDDLRRRARIYMFRGSSLQARYPDLPTAVDTLLTARVGTSGGPLDSEQRRKWALALRELGAAAEEASK